MSDTIKRKQALEKDYKSNKISSCLYKKNMKALEVIFRNIKTRNIKSLGLKEDTLKGLIS